MAARWLPRLLRASAPSTRAWTRSAAAAPRAVVPVRGFSTKEHAVGDEDELKSIALSLAGMDVQHRDYISLRWTDGRSSKFHLLHLRTWCPCPECQHSTGQRLINCSEIDPDKLDIADIYVKGDSINIEWAGDHHKSSFTWNWLRENCYSSATLDQEAKNMTTTALGPTSVVPTTEYSRMMETDVGLLEALHQIVENGLTVIRNTPCEPGQVKTLAERIAPVSHSFLYGDVFDVVAEPNPVNIAYTTVHLKHHLDLAYYESPPGFQFLHALRFDKTVKGGESTFVDTFAVAEEFRRVYPEHFATFLRVPATFQKRHLERSNPAIMVYQRPHIQLNHRDEVIAVHWSPPFEGPLKVPFDDVKPYYDAYRVFHEIVESGRHTVEFKLAEGDAVIFNQRRVLHGRKEFTAGSDGVRHLQGTYINIDDAFCRYNALRERLAPGDPAFMNRRAGNGNFA